MGIRRQGIERVQINCGQNQQCSPGQHLQHQRNQRGNQPQRDGQQHDAEEAIHCIHPRPRFGQELACRCADQQQGQAHAQAHDKQCQAAQCGIARVRDVEQGAGQRGSHAGADDSR